VTEEQRFGRYRVTGRLGAGAMGEVYAALDDALGREVAIKTLRAGASGLAARMLDDRFRQEARAIASLHHPGVVQLFDIDLAADPPYLVMERVAGPTLKQRLDDGAIAEPELRALGIQIGRALAAAHAAGVVHRDVKPANILGAGPAVWKLADFGVAHVPDSSLTMTGQFVGSPAYAPPEALVRGTVSAAGDVYGLGATLYEAAAGRWPRIDGTTTALFAPLPPLAQLAPALSREIAAAIDRAVAIEPDDRPSAAELADALAGLASHPGIAPAAAPAVASGAYPAPAVAPGPAAAFAPIADPARSAAPATAAHSPVPTAPLRWQRWAVLAAAVLAIAVLAATRGASPAAEIGAGVVPAASAADRFGGASDPASPPGRPGPPGLADKQRKDWNKIIEDSERGHLEAARHKLGDYEDRYGETDETRALRAEIDGLDSEPTDADRPAPPDDHRGGPPHGRHKKRKGD
jgi:serine/threonine-protein kinase